MHVSGRFSGTPGRSTVVRDGPFGKRRYTQLYAIRASAGGVIKFGISQSAAKRFAGLCTASPVPLELLGYVWMPPDAERYMFDFLRDHRSHGEWFRDVEPVRGVAALIAIGDVVAIADVIGMAFMLTRIVRPSYD